MGTEPAGAAAPRLRLAAISKSFNGVVALHPLELEMRASQVIGLCGENGAGKSTLINILAGHLRPDSGEIEIDGTHASLHSPADALRAGIAVIHQEFSLIDDLTVAENIRLGDEPRQGVFLDRRKMRREAQDHLDRFGFSVPVGAKVGRLATGQRQLVEIAKALAREAKILILDEPTAALNRAEGGRLLEILRSLRDRGIAILYVSHHLDEVLSISDRVVVLRDGWKVEDAPAEGISPEALIGAMVGHAIDSPSPKDLSAAPADSIRLEVSGLTAEGLESVDLSIRRGEILGATGLAGSGHEALAGAIFGDKPSRSGRIRLDGRPERFRSPREAIRAGLALVPGDRRGEGLLTTLDIERNLTITQLPKLSIAGWIRNRARKALATELADAFGVVRARLSQRADTLSGGNQQKVILARWSANRPKVFLLNHPTRGIDVRTREAIHQRIEGLAAEGVSILLVTSDLHELRRLADRILVFPGGPDHSTAQPGRMDGARPPRRKGRWTGDHREDRLTWIVSAVPPGPEDSRRPASPRSCS